MSGARHEDTMTPPSGLANAAASQSREMMAHTRLYRGGRLELEGFPAADISEYLADGSVTIWLDLRSPGRDDLAALSEQFGLTRWLSRRRCSTTNGSGLTATGAICS
jgi:hypothetical protein